jgi:hypothetical protein
VDRSYGLWQKCRQACVHVSTLIHDGAKVADFTTGPEAAVPCIIMILDSAGRLGLASPMEMEGSPTARSNLFAICEYCFYSEGDLKAACANRIGRAEAVLGCVC